MPVYIASFLLHFFLRQPLSYTKSRNISKYQEKYQKKYQQNIRKLLLLATIHIITMFSFHSFCPPVTGHNHTEQSISFRDRSGFIPYSKVEWLMKFFQANGNNWELKSFTQILIWTDFDRIILFKERNISIPFLRCIQNYIQTLQKLKDKIISINARKCNNAQHLRFYNFKSGSFEKFYSKHMKRNKCECKFISQTTP